MIVGFKITLSKFRFAQLIDHPKNYDYEIQHRLCKSNIHIIKIADS